MNVSIAEQRQIENEMIFRRSNEKVGDDLGALDAMHIEDGNPELIRDDKALLLFRCECSDEDCDERIPLKLSDYQEIHMDRQTFIVKIAHQVDAIEKIIKSTPDYNVVMKNNSTPEPGKDLNVTTINNT
ncbi:MAG: hypothetical protein ABIR37_04690 [Candidatus Saccharimonadales bacterium]